MMFFEAHTFRRGQVMVGQVVRIPREFPEFLEDEYVAKYQTFSELKTKWKLK